MRRRMFALMLGLIAFAVLAPLVEAGQYEQGCVGGPSDGECSQDLCCSCCVHFRVDPPRAASRAPGFSLTGTVVPRRRSGPAWPDPREVLHVPKPARL